MDHYERWSGMIAEFPLHVGGHDNCQPRVNFSFFIQGNYFCRGAGTYRDMRLIVLTKFSQNYHQNKKISVDYYLILGFVPLPPKNVFKDFPAPLNCMYTTAAQKILPIWFHLLPIASIDPDLIFDVARLNNAIPVPQSMTLKYVSVQLSVHIHFNFLPLRTH